MTHIRRRVVVIRNNNDRRPFVGDEPFRIAVVAVDVRVRLDAVPETRERKARESAQQRVRRPKGHPLAAVPKLSRGPRSTEGPLAGVVWEMKRATRRVAEAEAPFSASRIIAHSFPKRAALAVNVQVRIATSHANHPRAGASRI